ncbi:MAG: hypothetical protein J07HX64_01472 [halophilic archaeon J07HX64]|nr:MAG: hypothetical protein J07HX64_01472 [halophilic archaeon J07HX64]
MEEGPWAASPNLSSSADITDPVSDEAELSNEGTWESTSLDLPPIEVVPGIEPEITLTDGFSGEHDEERGSATVEGRIEATVGSNEGAEFTPEFPLDVTTGTSGSFEIQGGTVVDNESIVEDTFGIDPVDERLHLHSDSRFELTLAIVSLLLLATDRSDTTVFPDGTDALQARASIGDGPGGHRHPLVVRCSGGSVDWRRGLRRITGQKNSYARPDESFRHGTSQTSGTVGWVGVTRAGGLSR